MITNTGETQNALKCNPNPCSTCPYRKDTPPGIWAREEYEKLPAWDHEMAFAGIFLCHTDSAALCRGWIEVHERNISVRIAMFKVEWTPENREPTRVPLYASGMAAMRAGLSGVVKPSRTAKKAIAGILTRRARKANSVVKRTENHLAALDNPKSASLRETGGKP